MFSETIRTIIDLLMLRKTEKKLDADIKKATVDTTKAELDVAKAPLDFEKARLDLAKAQREELGGIGIIHPDRITLQEIRRYDPRTSRILRAAAEFVRSGNDTGGFRTRAEDVEHVAMGVFGHMEAPIVWLAYAPEDSETAVALWAELVLAQCHVYVRPIKSAPADTWQEEGRVDAFICILSEETVRWPEIWELMNSVQLAGLPLIPVLDRWLQVFSIGMSDENRTALLARCPIYVRYDGAGPGGRLPDF